ncbi:hypothetical protein [Falsiroseomonas sp. CW058]|uniref:hypothetical protein n=1 Tax=Falsiroseomonas sp. CW058 TaxID=3388664 RepID=UPI003D318F10
MTAITNLTLAPFAMLFRQAHAHPWLAIAISFAAGLGADLTGHDLWACALVSFGSYVMMWLGERDRPAEQGTHAENM